MGTHPIFESDFDCLTDFEEVAHCVCRYRSQKIVFFWIQKFKFFARQKRQLV